MTLVLDIEHLLGVAFAARDPSSGVPDWPPEPDRVFSALVASWGFRGEDEGERRALEWLEAQPAPEVISSNGFSRTAPTVFVPPNDAEGGRVGNAAVLPMSRRRQARRFPAFRPDNPVVSLIWHEANPNHATLAALNALAANTSYVGHSASLARCYFRHIDRGPAGQTPRRRVYPGRLAELQRDFRAQPLRRPSPGMPVRPISGGAAEERTNVFSERWLVLEHVEDGSGGEMPDIRVTALVAKALRNIIMSGYERIGLGDTIPAEISGHTADGRPATQPHLAIAPLAFVGWPHASGAVYGFGLVPPSHRTLLAERDFQRALGAVTQWNESEGRRELHLLGGGLDLVFATVGERPRRSLDPSPYVKPARRWASATPIVLDRHLKETGNDAREQEIAALILRACRNIGLPEPCGISAGKHSALEGAPSAYPSGRAPRWLGWRLPQTLASRQLTHALVEFAEPVRGPVILGAGRFVGLGVFRAFDMAEPRR